MKKTWIMAALTAAMLSAPSAYAQDLTVAVAGVTHRDLLLETPVTLPILQVQIQLTQFFQFAPVVLVLFHLGVVSQLVPVQLGVAQAGMIEVTGSLSPGQNVVVRGNERLRPDMPLKVASVIEIPEKE